MQSEDQQSLRGGRKGMAGAHHGAEEEEHGERDTHGAMWDLPRKVCTLGSWIRPSTAEQGGRKEAAVR